MLPMPHRDSKQYLYCPLSLPKQRVAAKDDFRATLTPPFPGKVSFPPRNPKMPFRSKEAAIAALLDSRSAIEDCCASGGGPFLRAPFGLKSFGSQAPHRA